MGLISINLKHQPIWIPVMQERGNRDHLVLVFSLNKTWEPEFFCTPPPVQFLY